MTTTLRAAVHRGKDYEVNLRYEKNHHWKTAGQLFRKTEKLVRSQTETADISLINFQDIRWYRQLYCTGELIKYSIAKAFIFSGSVLSLRRMGDDLVESWKKQIQWYSDNNYFGESDDGQLLEFEWKIFPGLTTLGILNQIQQMMGELQCEPENFTGRIMFMSVFNDIVWNVIGHDETCEKQFKDN